MDENRRILLIDDTHAIHDDFRKILTEQAAASDLDEMEAALFGVKPQAVSARYELDGALQGEEGVAKVRAAVESGYPYAMAFVDMRMPPGWDGVETIERLWEVDPRVQVVICTAYSDYSWDEVLDRLDVGDRLLVLKKPFDAIEVSQLASTLTAKWNLARQAELKMAALEEAVRMRTLQLHATNKALEADIMERKRAEQEASNAYRRIYDILEFFPDATFVIDTQGNVIAWNRAMTAMSGIAADEVLHHGDYCYALPFYRVRRKILIDLVDEPAEVIERCYPGARKEGERVTAEACVTVLGEERVIWSTATPLYDAHGSKVGAIQSLRDVTEARRGEQERSRLEARLHHSRMMESLMAQLGHDLKTPLTPLFALLPLVAKKVEEPSLARMLEICQQSVNQIHGLTSKALDLVRLSGRNNVPVLEPVPLFAAVECSIAGCAHFFSGSGVTCGNAVAHDIVVDVAPEQLNLLLENLLSNAARYASGVVGVTAAADGESVTVSVTDDGIGLMEGQSDRIFDEFFKADEARHDVSTQGLGLAICKRVVLNHGGRIWAESEGPGLGTTISFTLQQSSCRKNR